MTTRDALLLSYGEAASALEAPAVRFLARKQAAFLVAVFRTAFGSDVSQVQTHVLHLWVEQAQAELAAEGLEVPTGSGRDVCRGWMRDQWLRRLTSSDDAEVYVKTAHAEDALTTIERNVRERPQLSESTIATVLHAARRCAMDANPDAQVRLARLDEQIAALQAERDRVADGGEIEVASDARMLERLANLSRLLADLPADFLAAAEAIDDIHRELADAFRADDRPASTVIREYLNRLEALGEDARAAAFVGASELFRNDVARQGLRDDLDVFLSHPFTRHAPPELLARARGAVVLLQSGVDQVLARRRRASETSEPESSSELTATARSERSSTTSGIASSRSAGVDTAGARRLAYFQLRWKSGTCPPDSTTRVTTPRHRRCTTPSSMTMKGMGRRSTSCAATGDRATGHFTVPLLSGSPTMGSCRSQRCSPTSIPRCGGPSICWGYSNWRGLKPRPAAR